MNPISIALLAPANSIHTRRWAESLSSRGHKVLLISQHPFPQRGEYNFSWLPFKGQFGYFANAYAVRKLLREFRPAVLHAHYASGYGTLARLANYRPMLLSVWGSDVYDFPYVSPLHRYLVRTNIESASRVASTSVVMAGQVGRIAPGLEPTLVTPFGVDFTLFTPREQVVKHCNEGEKPIVFGIVKTLAPKYGIDALLRAFAIVARTSERPINTRLIVVGEGPQEAELKQLSRHLNIDDITTFVGAIPHTAVPIWLRKFDVYVAPSQLDSESFGVAVLEASSCGIPVVVTDVGGLPEVVVQGQTGYVVQKGDIAALASAMSKLGNDANLRRAMGESGRKHVVETYSWGRSVDLMEQAYAETIGSLSSTRTISA